MTAQPQSVPGDMTLRESDHDRQFRAEARQWLDAHRPRETLPPAHSVEGFERRRLWEQTLFDAGWAAVHWPSAFGGRDATTRESTMFAEEYLRCGAPERINGLGLNLFGPALLEFGTEEQRRRWLPSILRCDDIWCQGFSEPDAGSDLAALRSTARLDGDEFTVNGQKIWTSLASFGDWIFTLVRTDPEAPKHRGISMLAIDMKSPGIEVRPLRQIDGDPSFGEVFFTDVVVPADQLIGDLNDGWRVAMHALGLERGSAFGAHVTHSMEVETLARLRAHLAHSATAGEVTPDLDERLAKVYVESEALRALSWRMLSRLELGRAHGAEPSMAKLFRTELHHEILDLGLAMMGELGELEGGSPELDAALDADLGEHWAQWHHHYWYSRAAKIFAGTSQVQRNIIAERWLDLPKEELGASRTR